MYGSTWQWFGARSRLDTHIITHQRIAALSQDLQQLQQHDGYQTLEPGQLSQVIEQNAKEARIASTLRMQPVGHANAAYGGVTLTLDHITHAQAATLLEAVRAALPDIFITHLHIGSESPDQDKWNMQATIMYHQ